MSASLAAQFASFLRLGEDMDVDSETWRSEGRKQGDATSPDVTDSGLRQPYDAGSTLFSPSLCSMKHRIVFDGRKSKTDGVPMRVLVNKAFPCFLRDGDDPVAHFEESENDYIVVNMQWPGYRTRAEIILTKDDKGEPITLRALAEEVARHWLGYMKDLACSHDTENPTVDGIAFDQLHLVALRSPNEFEWEAELRRRDLFPC